MKVTAVMFAFLLAGVSALPNLQTNQLESTIRSGEPRLVTGNIEQAIKDLSNSIVEAGMDPFTIDHLGVDYATPVPTVFNVKAHVHGVESTGLSHIVINRLNYAVITSRLTCNLELPEIALRVKDAAWNLNVLSGKLKGAISGSITLNNLVLKLDVRVSIGVISGISIRSMELEMDLGRVDSRLKVNIQGQDISDHLNHYLGWKVPNALREFKDDINQCLTIVARDLIEANL